MTDDTLNKNGPFCPHCGTKFFQGKLGGSLELEQKRKALALRVLDRLERGEVSKEMTKETWIDAKDAIYAFKIMIAQLLKECEE
jgi:hypothetical protein